MKFEWNHAKAVSNLKKHDVSFHEAATIFGDPLAVTHFDPDHSETEQRYITYGMTEKGRLVMVSHTDRDETIRIISARPMTEAERKLYEEE